MALDDQLTAKQRETLAFAEQMTGTSVVDGPPPPDSPLAKIMALSAALQADLITADEMRAGVERIQRQALVDSGEQPT